MLRKKSVLPIISFCFILGLCSFSLAADNDATWYDVLDVLDGDTLKVSGNKIVELIGVDAPEKSMSRKLRLDAQKTGQSIYDIMKMGRDASAVCYSLIAGKPVRLEYDIEREDEAGNLRAYVYLSTGEMLNAQMIAKGKAFYLKEGVNKKHSALFESLEVNAREKRKGIWTEIELDMHHK